MKISLFILVTVFFTCIDLSAQLLESNYLNETHFPIVKNNYIVLSGHSGEEKSRLLSGLKNRGYVVTEEPETQIIKEQKAIGSGAVPWDNLSQFSELVLSRYLFHFNSHNDSKKLVFFDRGIVDTVFLDQLQPEYFQRAAITFRYNPLVFFYATFGWDFV